MPITPTASTLRSPLLDTRSTDELPVATPRPPWIWTHGADAWTVCVIGGKSYLLPDLARRIGRPGVNGWRQIPQGGTPADQWRPLVSELRGAGVTVLTWDLLVPADLLPPGVEAGPYLRELSVRPPRQRTIATHYVSAWDVPTATAPGRPLITVHDGDQHRRWLLHLVESGVIAPPTSHQRDELVREARSALERAQSIPWASQALADQRIGAAQQLLDRARAAILPDPASATPSPSRRPRGAAPVRSQSPSADEEAE